MLTCLGTDILIGATNFSSSFISFLAELLIYSKATHRMQSKKWKVTKRTQVFDSKFVKVYEDRVILPNGKVIEDYTLIKKLDAVIVVATDVYSKLVTVKEYKHGIGNFQVALPSGYKNPKEGPVAAARRELLEETGFGEGVFRSVGVLYDDPAKDLRKTYVVRAINVHPLREQKLDETETISQVKLLSINKLREQFERKQWRAATSISALVISGYLFENIPINREEDRILVSTSGLLSAREVYKTAKSWIEENVPTVPIGYVRLGLPELDKSVDLWRVHLFINDHTTGKDVDIGRVKINHENKVVEHDDIQNILYAVNRYQHMKF